MSVLGVAPRALEEKILKIQDEPLRIELLAADAGRAAGGAAAALRAVVRVEEILPGEVVETAHPEGLGLLEVDRLELALGLLRGEEDIEGGGHDVQVLGVRQVHEEAQEEHGVEPPRHVEDGGDCPRRQMSEHAREEAPRELPVVGRRGGEHDPARVGSKVRDHEPEDQEQDEEALGGEGEAAGLRHQPAVGRVGDGRDDGHAEGVFEDQVVRRIRKKGKVEPLGHPLPEELDGPEREDDEAPEDRGMHEPGPEVVLQEPRLAEDVHEDRDQSLGHLVPSRLRLPRQDEPEEKDRASRKEHEGDGDQRVEREPAGYGSVPLLRGRHSAKPPWWTGVGPHSARRVPECQGRRRIVERICETAEYESSVPSATASMMGAMARSCSMPASTSLAKRSTRRVRSSARRRAWRRFSRTPEAPRTARCRLISARSSATPTSLTAWVASTGVSQSMSLGEALLE